jgi:thiosulfate reductase cytochrome b subunit
MEDLTVLPGLAIPHANGLENLPRHSAIARVTHWINTLAFLGLLVSGIAIILAPPRFYWGEAGAVGAPSLFDLPLPFVLVGQTGWGRYLHFLSAWIFVLNGLLYVASGFVTRRFRRESAAYNAPQRLTYLAVVFVLSPLIIWTGLAMSPALTSVFPAIVTTFGGQQSARTLHFFAADLLVLFLIVHITMVSLAGFTNHVRGMITGRIAGKESA